MTPLPLSLSLSLSAALTSSAALSQCFERILNRAALLLCTDMRLKADTFIVRDSCTCALCLCRCEVPREADGVHQRRYLEENTQDSSESLDARPYGPLVQPRRECPPLCFFAVRVIAGDMVALELPDDAL